MQDFCVYACGSSAPVRIESDAAWLARTLEVQSVQGHGLPLPQELWLHQSLFLSLLQLANQKASLVSLFPLSGTERDLLPGILLYFSVWQAHRGNPPGGVLLCRLAYQALKGGPWMRSYSSSVHQAFDGPSSLLFSC